MERARQILVPVLFKVTECQPLWIFGGCTTEQIVILYLCENPKVTFYVAMQKVCLCHAPV